MCAVTRLAARQLAPDLGVLMTCPCQGIVLLEYSFHFLLLVPGAWVTIFMLLQLSVPFQGQLNYYYPFFDWCY